MPTSPVRTYSADRIDPVWSTFPAPEIPVKLPASISYDEGTILGEIVGTNEVITLTIDATGGTFTLTFGGQTTSAIAEAATAATVQAAMEALSTIGAGNVSVSGSAGGPYTITFQNDLGNTNVGAVTTNAASLTGGAGTATVAVVTSGSAGTPGTYKKVDPASTDGSQNARAILKYAASTDSSGNITLFGEHGETELTAPAYVGGAFDTADLPTLTMTDVTNLGGTIVKGSIAGGGILKF